MNNPNVDRAVVNLPLGAWSVGGTYFKVAVHCAGQLDSLLKL